MDGVPAWAKGLACELGGDFGGETIEDLSGLGLPAPATLGLGGWDNDESAGTVLVEAAWRATGAGIVGPPFGFGAAAGLVVLAGAGTAWVAGRAWAAALSLPFAGGFDSVTAHYPRLHDT
jgi:hypothetical protein